jgi:hypothetical protein
MTDLIEPVASLCFKFAADGYLQSIIMSATDAQD